MKAALLFFLAVAIWALPSPAYAASWSAPCVAGPEGDVATIRGITCLVSNLLSPLPALIALAALAMLIWSGARLISAGANQQAYASAWQTFSWAIIGIILLSGAWLALVLIEKFTGAEVTQFGFPD
ncbi:hypothetical protein HY333_01565 [Candidatus Collierbacteria bacterium]|nr:hypothetical protein [Candidatus Collierbacteria bacterium]